MSFLSSSESDATTWIALFGCGQAVVLYQPFFFYCFWSKNTTSYSRVLQMGKC